MPLKLTSASRIAATVVAAAVVAGCATGTPAPAPAPASAEQRPAPTRALVTWADSMCELEADLAAVQGQLEADLVSFGGPAELAELMVDGYLSFAPSRVERLVTGFDELAPSGTPGGDELVGRFQDELERVLAGIEELTGGRPVERSVPVSERQALAQQIDDLIGSISPAEPTLLDLVAADATLAEAYGLAPRCEAPATPGADGSSSAEPLPPAADGSDIGACADGACQVLVSEPVEIVTYGFAFTVGVENGVVVTETDSGRSTSSSVGGGAAFGDAQVSVEISIVALDATSAVLDISASRT